MQVKTHSRETKQTSEPDLNATQMLEWSDRELKITMINIWGNMEKYVRGDG